MLVPAVLVGALLPAAFAGATTADPCVGWTEVELASGLGMVENLEPDGRGGMLLGSSDRDQIERLLPDGTVELAFADVQDPGGMRVVGDVLFVNTGDSASSAVLNMADGTVERIDLDTGQRVTWTDGLVMPNGLARATDGRLFTSRDLGAEGWISLIPADEPRTPIRWAEITDTNGLAIDAAQEWLYVTTTFDPLAPVNRVRLDDPTTIELVANLTSVGVPVVKGLDDMTIDGADILYITANGSGEVLRLDPSTGDACVIASGIGNPTSTKFGAGPGWDPTHLYVTAWDGIVRELIPPAGAAPTPLPGEEDAVPDGGTVDEPTSEVERSPLADTGGGAVLLAAAGLAAGVRLRRRRATA